MKKLFVFLLLGAAFLLSAKDEIFFMKDGKPACTILVKENAGKVEQHAAKEFAKYLARIADGKAPEIAKKPEEGKVSVRFELTKDKRVEEEGFKIDANKKEVVISGKDPIAFLYGAYYILKKYGGIRWLTPLPDGEYFTVKKDIKMPAGEFVSNPSFTFRNINWGAANNNSRKWGSFDWMVRNNLRIFDIAEVILNPALKEGLLERGAIIQDGGHCFSNLLTGYGAHITKWKDHLAELHRLYKEHPEYFPLIDGKRTFLEGHKYQPCTSNEDVIRLMSDHLIEEIRKNTMQTPGGRFRLVNNDGTGWCECENCKKIDRDDKGMTTRYWTFINQLVDRTLKAIPGALINSIAYQNYQAAPTSILPHKGLQTVELSFNRLCYRHFIDDPNCVVNSQDYYIKHKDWARLAQKHGYNLVTYAQIDDMGRQCVPIDEVYLHDIKHYYHVLGIRGLRPQLSPVDGTYHKRYDDLPMVRLEWHAQWQVLYAFSQLCWDVDADVDAIYEESGSLYYGKAWKNGMQKYRKLLNKAYRETPGCHGHGHASKALLGRGIDHPAVYDGLLACLNSAEKAAKTDPDKRALKHVQTDKKIFELTWKKYRENYRKNIREFRSYRKKNEIRIDGVLDEADWKNADVISGFKTIDYDGKPAKYPTAVRVVHEPDAIYFGIEAMEPKPGEMLASIREKDGKLWNDSTLEIFLSYPDLGRNFYQIIVNSLGTVFDQFVQPGADSNVKWDSQIQVKTRVLKDRWVLEAKIPTGPIGEKCFDGQFWKVNVLRARKMKNASENESSTWSMGKPHSVEAFQAVNFVAARKSNDRYEKITPRTFPNWTLNEAGTRKYTDKNGRWKVKDSILPAYWYPAGPGGELEFIRDGKDPKNAYVKLKGILTNDYWGRNASFVKIRIRAKGKGVFIPAWYCYDESKGKNQRRKHRASLTIGKYPFDHADWKEIVIMTKLPPYEVTKFALEAVPEKDSEIYVDSVLITQEEKESVKK
ncbi:MAG: DUF4838 domain-containing protein [Lentisphaeria bacterium]|nr:DUF4838 domain-containing protein [Lentisphaeria bacterium]